MGRNIGWAGTAQRVNRPETGRLLSRAEFGPLGEQTSNGPEVIEGRKGAQERMGRQ